MLDNSRLAFVSQICVCLAVLFSARASATAPANPYRSSLTAELQASGLVVKQAGVHGGQQLAQLSPRRIVRADQSLKLGVGQVIRGPKTSRVERQALTEWLDNSGSLPEHGFTLPTRWGNGDGTLVLELETDADLLAYPTPDGRAIRFRLPSGLPAFSYRELTAFDSNRERLDARFHLVGRTIRIEIDDRFGHYPITIDPLIDVFDWSHEGTGPGAQFGQAITVAGDVNGDGMSDLLVGSPGFDDGLAIDAGRLELFLGSPNGLGPTATWSFNGTSQGARLGATVAALGDLDGDGFGDVAVGAPGEGGVGVVRIFSGTSAGLALNPSQTLQGVTAAGSYGGALAGAGDLNNDGWRDLAVSAVDAQQVLIHYGTPSGLSVTATTITAPASAAQFGQSLDLIGDLNGDGIDDLAIGDPEMPILGAPTGGVHIYLGSATGVSTNPTWTIAGDQAGARFGARIFRAGDVDGDSLADFVIAAPRFDTGVVDAGRIRLVRGTAAAPQLDAAWSQSGVSSEEHLGESLFTAGDLNADGYADVAVGAPGFRSGVGTLLGRVVAYFGSKSGLSNVPAWEIVSPDPNQGFAEAVATAGDVDGDGFSDLVIGAPAFGGDGRGRVVMIRGYAELPAVTTAWELEEQDPGAALGQGLAIAGDVNADGYLDVLYSSAKRDGIVQKNGLVALRSGGPNGLEDAAWWSVEGTVEKQRLGWFLDGIGDVNADGYADLAISSEIWPGTNPPVSGVGVYYGGPSGPGPVSDWSFVAPTDAERFSMPVAGIGDVNGDGVADFAIGSANYNLGAESGGIVRVFLGSSSGITNKPAWSYAPHVASGEFGRSVNSAGDVNGDGFSDLIVGAPGIGRAYVFAGSPNGLRDDPIAILIGTATSRFGSSVAGAGDVDNDGFGEVLVGAPFDGAESGSAYLYAGSSSGVQSAPVWTRIEPELLAQFGDAVGSAGDLNADGYGDFVVAQGWGASAFVFLGSASGPADAPSWIADGIATSVAGAGDITGDGFGDLVLGQRLMPPGGRIRCFLGNAASSVTGGRPAKPLQRSDLFSPLLQTHARAPHQDHAALSIVPQVPRSGLRQVRMVSEREPTGRPFDGIGIANGNWVSDSTAQPIEAALTGLAPAAFHTWRSRIQTSDPYFPGSAWFTESQTAATDADFRTAGCLDQDGDGRGFLLDPSCAVGRADCSDSSSVVWATPGDPRNLRVLSDKSTFAWLAPNESGTSVAPRYDLVRSALPFSFEQGALCSATGVTALQARDVLKPLPGGAFYYLVRATNACPGATGRGHGGENSFGEARRMRACN